MSKIQYDTFHKRGAQSAPSDDYTAAELLSSLIVFDSNTFKYSVFDFDEFATHMAESEEIHYWNEVQAGERWQKFKLDIDGIDPNEIAGINITDPVKYAANDDINRYLALLKVVITYAFDQFGETLDESNFIVCGSQRPDDDAPPKWSFHIIIDGFCVASHRHAKHIASVVRNYLPDVRFIKYIDFGIYGSTQNLRIAGCVKKNDTNRIKLILSDGVGLLPSLITYVKDCEKMAFDIDAPIIAQPTGLDSYDVADAVAALKKFADQNGCEFMQARGSILYYMRSKPAHCDICDRVHDSDNTFYGIISLNRAVSWLCRHDTGETVRYVTSLVNTQSIADLIDSTDPVYEHGLFNDLPRECQNIYSARHMKQYETAEILCVRANMGLGKTKQLRDLLEANYPAKDRSAKIIILSFRQTFSTALKSSLANFDLYSDPKIKIEKSRRLIIQLESLHKLAYSSGENPTLLILDECESILDQFGSGLFGNLTLCFKVFLRLIKFSDRIIFMDANLSNRSYKVLEALRENFHPSAIMFHHNTYTIEDGREYHITSKIGVWMHALLIDVAAGKKVVIPVNSIIMSKTLHTILLNRFAGLVIGLYNSETSINVKRRDFADVAKWWAVDVLIYTPTVSAGISFEVAHFDAIYAYTISTCTVEAALQMMGRVRDIAERKYIIFVSLNTLALPVTSADIERSIQFDIDLLKSPDTVALDYEFNRSGTCEIIKTPYYSVWVENTINRNLSKNSFTRRLISFIKHLSKTIDVLGAQSFEDVTGEPYDAETVSSLENLIKDVRDGVKRSDAADIAKAVDLEPHEYENIAARVQNEQPITDAERHSFDKFNLAKYYRYTRPITDEFAYIYGDPLIKRTYRTLRELYGAPSLALSLAQIKATQIHLREQSSQQYHESYTYTKHVLLIQLVELLGFEIFDLDNPTESQDVAINEIICEKIDAINAIIDKLYQLFELKFTPSILNTKVHFTRTGIFRKVNKLLSLMYDKKITKNGKSPVYSILQGEIFDFDTNCEERPHIENYRQ
jgi:hypothetical protein